MGRLYAHLLPVNPVVYIGNYVYIIDKPVQLVKKI